MGRPRKSNPLTPESLAAEGAGGADRSTQLGTRLGRYGTAKSRNHAMAGYALAHGYKPLSDRMYRCGAYLQFRQWLAHDRTTLHQGKFCQLHTLCPLCAIRRGGKLLRRYVERAAYLARTHDLYLVTLTVKNGPDLAERFEHLRQSVRKMRERAKKGYGEFSRATGALYSVEFTKSDKGWHPHVHMVWSLPKGDAPLLWGKDSKLGREWHDITGDSFIVHAERIRADDDQALVKAFCEVLKYALKFSDLELGDNLSAYFTLKGRRLMGSTGVWWGLELPDDALLEDDPLDGPYVDWFFRYAGSRGYVLEEARSADGGLLYQNDPNTLPATDHQGTSNDHDPEAQASQRPDPANRGREDHPTPGHEGQAGPTGGVDGDDRGHDCGLCRGQAHCRGRARGGDHGADRVSCGPGDHQGTRGRSREPAATTTEGSVRWASKSRATNCG